IYNTHNTEYKNIPEGKHKLRFTTNHDESAWNETPVILFNGKKGALAASVITIFLGGVPLIYGSQEVGVPEPISFFENDPIDWTLNPDMLKTYRDIISVYNSSEAFRTGSLTTYNDANISIFKRTSGTEEYLIIVNTRNRNISVNTPSDLINTSWSDVFNNTEVQFSQTINLDPYEYRIFRTEIPAN
ncbi:MAG: alpha-glucosidase C-terminal domain-containing protein, partial [Candidatus Neomarinimicrobiota bacterium]